MCVNPTIYRYDGWSEHHLCYSHGSPVAAPAVCMMVAPLSYSRPVLWYDGSPLCWSRAAFLTLGLNAQGKAVGQSELEIKTWNKSSFFETLISLWCFYMNYMLNLFTYLYVSLLSSKTAYDTISPVQITYLSRTSKLYSFEFLNEAMLHQKAYFSVTQQ